MLIEHCRLSSDNPVLPKELEHDYFESLKKLEQYLLTNFKTIQDETALRETLSLFATLNGQRDLGKAIQLLDDDMLKEFLGKF